MSAERTKFFSVFLGVLQSSKKPRRCILVLATCLKWHKNGVVCTLPVNQMIDTTVTVNERNWIELIVDFWMYTTSDSIFSQPTPSRVCSYPSPPMIWIIRGWDEGIACSVQSLSQQSIARESGWKVHLWGLFFNRHLHGMVWFVNVLVELSSGWWNIITVTV